SSSPAVPAGGLFDLQPHDLPNSTLNACRVDVLPRNRGPTYKTLAILWTPASITKTFRTVTLSFRIRFSCRSRQVAPTYPIFVSTSLDVIRIRLDSNRRCGFESGGRIPLGALIRPALRPPCAVLIAFARSWPEPDPNAGSARTRRQGPPSADRRGSPRAEC